MKKIVLFASGNGSNVENIIRYFKNNSNVSVIGVFSNNQHAKVLERAKNHNIYSESFTKSELTDGTVFQKIKKLNPDLIVLAGFLLKFPETIIHEFTNKVINIHPALLPKYGGKGMYGNHVHQAILENKEKETGITIHYVNENYDEGKFIFQEKVNIENCSSIEEIASKVQELEHDHFPKTIEKLLIPNP
ncbi:phosphoribosylglycinamide formyltransferase [Flavobacterium capsici]|uniref:Phosphoribosylglycinamide formyltransferase n=1 Tax=Flavobacterium capsici TaxID=3075618 RepID=A0AA96J9V1_9FLAO|nr:MULTISPECIES: phosphoribosylglycinamide formyltransferase [unclassified Flavobacterium]WNM19535.1 phosphoribosylglycinamide formyltransferase [Flavobacterium sp. PMR2A8]WNM20924.1 phosphoribosylglycinamide formyltransferase [Flavobacterium sp. PMTSA4]